MKNKKVKKKLIYLFSVMLVVISFVLIVISFNKNKDVLLYVNNEPIHKEEFINSSRTVLAATRNELMREYEIQSEDFSWSKEIEEGKEALDFLLDKALKDCVYIKVLQIKAKENDLINSIDYKSIKRDMDLENKKREKNKKNNEVIYGTISFEFRDYYQYMNNNLSIQLRKKMIDDGVIDITKEEMEKFYEENREMFLYKNESTGTIENVPFNEVESNVKDAGLNQKFNQYINQEVEKASVKINDEGRLRDILEGELL